MKALHTGSPPDVLHDAVSWRQERFPENIICVPHQAPVNEILSAPLISLPSSDTLSGGDTKAPKRAW